MEHGHKILENDWKWEEQNAIEFFKSMVVVK